MELPTAETAKHTKLLGDFIIIAGLRADPIDPKITLKIIISMLYDIDPIKGYPIDAEKMAEIAHPHVETVDIIRATYYSDKLSADSRRSIIASLIKMELLFNRVSEFPSGECSICLQSFKPPIAIEEQKIIYSCWQCKCLIHEDCAAHWYAIKKSCPICRFEL